MTDDELKRLLAENAEETRRHFDVSTEGIRREIRIVAEAVIRGDEKLAAVRDEMRAGFGETQSMIKFSHTELDRRIRALEDSQRDLAETVVDLQARIERLESSTH